MLFILAIFSLCSIPFGVLGQPSCVQSGQLTVFTKTVQRKGYEFEKAEVNRTVPVELVYSVVANGEEMESVQFEHNEKPVTVGDDTDSELHYAVSTEGPNLRVKLHIGQPTARVTGDWSMTLTTKDGEKHVASCPIKSQPILRLNLGAVRGNEGKPISATCHLESSPNSVTVSWERYSESTDGRVLEPVQNVEYGSDNGVENNVIKWTNGSKAGGFYLCTAKSELGLDTTLVEVRVKTIWTYLWPSIGILLEIIVLVITIVIYERMQAKKRRAQNEHPLNGSDK